MKKNFKKTISIVIAVMIMLVSSVALAFALMPIKFAVSSAEGVSGDEVTVNVSVSDNHGFSSFTIDLIYDSNYLEAVSATKLSTGIPEFDNGQLFFNQAFSDNVIRTSYFSTVDNTFNGDIISFTFRIKETLLQTNIPVALNVFFISKEDIATSFSGLGINGNIAIVERVSSMESFEPVVLLQSGDIANNNVQYQTSEEVISALPKEIEVKLENDLIVSVPITWVNEGIAYNPFVAGEYQFTASWGTLPDGVSNEKNLIAPVCLLKVVQGETSAPELTLEIMTNSKILEKLAARIKVKVTSFGFVPETPIKVELQSLDGIVYASVFTDQEGIALVEFSATPPAGTYVFVATYNDIQANAALTVEPYNMSIWEIAAMCAPDETRTMIVFAEIPAHQSGSFDGKVTVNGVSIKTGTSIQGYSIILPVNFNSLVSGDTIVVKEVRYPDLFPSYSFTFTVII